MEKDIIQNAMGDFGRYQFSLFFWMSMSKFVMAFHQMAIIFLAPKISYICGLNGTDTYCPCSDPIFDTSFSNTITMEWGLICNRKWLISFTHSLYHFGVLLGSVIFGTLADRFGRKPSLLIAVVIQISAGIAAAYSPDYWTFTLLRFLVGMSVGGTMVTCFIILMEFIGIQYREIITALFQAWFNVGHMAISLFGYFFTDFSDFQLAISVSAALMLPYFVLIRETPRWLIAVKKTDQAVSVLECVAKRNKRPTKNIKADISAHQEAIEKTQQLKKGTILDLFHTPNLRKNIIAMAINWLACSYCFNGVSQYVGHISGNVFINVTSSAGVNLLGTLLSIPLIKVIGRRTVVIAFHFISAACLLILALIPDGVGSVVLASGGMVSSSIVFMVSYLYCAEMFPTVVRNSALGFSSMSARVGSMIAPFVIDLQSVASWLPPVMFAILPLIAGCVTFLLPETKGCELTTTLEEGEQFRKKSKT